MSSSSCVVPFSFRSGTHFRTPRSQRTDSIKLFRFVFRPFAEQRLRETIADATLGPVSPRQRLQESLRRPIGRTDRRFDETHAPTLVPGQHVFDQGRSQAPPPSRARNGNLPDEKRVILRRRHIGRQKARQLAVQFRDDTRSRKMVTKQEIRIRRIHIQRPACLDQPGNSGGIVRFRAAETQFGHQTGVFGARSEAANTNSPPRG